MDAVVVRLHRKLVEALLDRGPDGLDRPVTVAEIYQDLVPYRTVRSALGVELNADYEHALLRLLAGEGDLVRLEPANARDELRTELKSPNPYVGLYRNFAACDVRVNRGEAEVGRGDVAPTKTPAPAAVPAPASSRVPGPPAVAPRAARPDSPVVPAAAGDGGACNFCREPLPKGRAVRYCPFCGRDQHQHPCGECGEALERAWRYCIRCGTTAAVPSGG